MELVVKVDGWPVSKAWAMGNDIFSNIKPPAGLRRADGRNWFQSDLLKFYSSGLLTRLETPWAWASYKSFEQIISE